MIFPDVASNTTMAADDMESNMMSKNMTDKNEMMNETMRTEMNTKENSIEDKMMMTNETSMKNDESHLMEKNSTCRQPGVKYPIGKNYYFHFYNSDSFEPE